MGTDRCSASLVPFSGCHLHRCLTRGPGAPELTLSKGPGRTPATLGAASPLLADYGPLRPDPLPIDTKLHFQRRLGLSGGPKGPRGGEELGARSTPPGIDPPSPPLEALQSRDWEFPRDAFR